MIIVLSTYPDRNSAKKSARMLIEEGLAACVSIVPIESSIYNWKGKLMEEREFLLIIKTTETRYKKLETAIKGSHPHSLPEIIRVPVAGGWKPYLDWVDRSGRLTGPRSRRS